MVRSLFKKMLKQTITSTPSEPTKPEVGQICHTGNGVLVYDGVEWKEVSPPSTFPKSPRWDLIEEYPELSEKYQEFLELQKHYEAWSELMKQDEAADNQGAAYYYAPYIPIYIKKG